MQRHLVLTAAALALAAGASTRTAAQQRPVSVIVGLGPAQAVTEQLRQVAQSRRFCPRLLFHLRRPRRQS